MTPELKLYIDAYETLTKHASQELVSEENFYRLICEFLHGFLETKNYQERIIKHRVPMEVRNEVLQESYDYIRRIDQRPEMQDIEIKNGITIQGYVPTRVVDVWKSDKKIKSLYRSIKVYCEITGKDFNTIAIHIAERRALEKVGAKIRKDIRKAEHNKNNQPKLFRPFGNMNIVNVEPFIKSFLDYQCGLTEIAQISSRDFEIKQFETQPLDGFSFQPGFPNCCENHKNLLKIGKEKFLAFPNCCEAHKNLLKASWFSKDNYSYMPLKFVTTLTYTWHCITKNIDNDNWYKEITDYIDYTKKSFGQFPDSYGSPIGLDLYLHNLQKNLEDATDISILKKQRLLAFIQDYYKQEEQIEQTDLNLLISKYKEWLKIFPFEIPFFKPLKSYFEKQLPILSGKGDTNIYTGITGFKLTSKNELIGFLTATTLKIIQEINSLHLYNNGLLSNPFEMQRQVIIARRKLEIEELNKAAWTDRKEYIKLLKKWLTGEKKFLSEITPLIQKEHSILTFVTNIIDGMKELQNCDTNAPCIMNVRNHLPGKETSFRYWFKSFLAGRYPDAVISAEEEKGNGKIDLKVTQKPLGSLIVEFKGWWNYDKKKSPEQLCSYLTEFEQTGFIFMINHLKETDIVSAYKDLITDSSMKYVSDSWKEHKIENTDFSYYESKHKFSLKEKSIYHFVFNVHFSNQLKKNSLWMELNGFQS